MAAALAASLAAHAQDKITLVDRIVAVVNKEVITLTELDEAVARAHPYSGRALHLEMAAQPVVT